MSYSIKFVKRFYKKIVFLIFTLDKSNICSYNNSCAIQTAVDKQNICVYHLIGGLPKEVHK